MLLSCAHTPSASDYKQDYQSGVLQAEKLLNEYGELEGQYLTSYFRELTSTLARAIPEREHPRCVFSVRMIDRPEPIAISTGGGFILLSRGLVRSLSSESELAFVISHEMAHQVLGHLSDENGTIDESSVEEHHAFELSADRYAVSLVALSGYDPRNATSSVLHVAGVRALDDDNSTHPSLQTRLSSLEQALIDSKWAPPGIVDTRSFRKLKSIL